MIFPKRRHEKEEVEFIKRATILTQEVLKYLEICEALPENLTKSEKRGLKKLKKRIKKGDSV